MWGRRKIGVGFGLVVAFGVIGTYLNFSGYKLNTVRLAVEQNRVYRFDSNLMVKMMPRNSTVNKTNSEVKKESKGKEDCKTDYFKNALLYGRHRNRKGFLTIGIPSMKRPENKTYIHQTLDSLLKNSNLHEQNEMVIVIFLCDLEPDIRCKQAKTILERYPEHLDSGLIQIIEAPVEFYPSFENLKRYYDHSTEQVKWRSKQNIDYAFLMKYSQNISEYYLQLEDDVLTVPRYMGRIKSFIKSRRRRWTCLEFSSLGFIAKLFHSYDLNQLSDFLIMFYSEQPGDLIYLRFNDIQVQFRRIILKPTIFQHFGFTSTLTIRKLRLEDPFFKNAAHKTKSKEKTKIENNIKGKLKISVTTVESLHDRDSLINRGNTVESLHDRDSLINSGNTAESLTTVNL